MSTAHGYLEADYAPQGSVPWIPFTPISEEVLLRYFRIDPLRGEILVSARCPPHLGLAPIYHTGPVIAHTTHGAWRYRENGWISRPGDTVYEAAASIRTAESVGDEEAVVFLVVTGEFLFFDEGGSLVWQESWKTSMERYAEYCAEHRLRRDDLTG